MRFHQAFIVLLVAAFLTAAPAFAQDAEEPEVPLEEYSMLPKGVLLPEGVFVETTGEEKKEESPPEQPPTDESGAMNMDDINLAYQQGKYDVIVKPLTALANNKSHPAEELLGILYHSGQGVEKNFQEALYWLNLAAEAGRPLAEHHLAIMWYLGEGVEKDPAQALMRLYCAIIHYADGPDKQRAIQDRDNIHAQTTRRDKARAKDLAREWLQKRGEAHLLDVQDATAP